MVAMKKLKFPDLQEDDDMIQDIKEEFEKEIQLLANLRHKNESRQNNFVLII